MRTAEISIGGKTCLIVMNNRVLSRMEESGLSLEHIGEGKKVTNIMNLLAYMIEAGSRYAAREGLGEYPALTLEELLDLTDTEDYAAIQEAIAACVAGDRTVDSIPPKKAEAAPAQAPGA